MSTEEDVVCQHCSGAGCQACSAQHLRPRGYPVDPDLEPLDFSDAEHIYAAVAQAVGAGSASWDNLEGAGTFDDRRARAACEGLINWLRDNGAIMVQEKAPEATFQRELASLINKYSLENGSGTPDFILASFLANVLVDLEHAIHARASWRGESVELPALQGLRAKQKVQAVLERNGYTPDDVPKVLEDFENAGIQFRQ